jgi:hypothetical protein
MSHHISSTYHHHPQLTCRRHCTTAAIAIAHLGQAGAAHHRAPRTCVTTATDDPPTPRHHCQQPPEATDMRHVMRQDPTANIDMHHVTNTVTTTTMPLPLSRDVGGPPPPHHRCRQHPYATSPPSMTPTPSHHVSANDDHTSLTQR